VIYSFDIRFQPGISHIQTLFFSVAVSSSGFFFEHIKRAASPDIIAACDEINAMPESTDEEAADKLWYFNGGRFRSQADIDEFTRKKGRKSKHEEQEEYIRSGQYEQDMKQEKINWLPWLVIFPAVVCICIAGGFFGFLVIFVICYLWIFCIALPLSAAAHERHKAELSQKAGIRYKSKEKEYNRAAHHAVDSLVKNVKHTGKELFSSGSKK
jgi:hypothetical protein